MRNELMSTPTDDDLLFEESYLVETMPEGSLSAVDDADTSMPLAIVSAAYGYTRGGQYSALMAGLFGFFGYQYPLLAATLVAADAVIVQGTPAGEYAKRAYAKHSPTLKQRMGFSGITTPRRRCKNGSRRRGGVCVRTR